MIDIQPQLLTLSGLLTKRLFRIPQYQRAYSWTSRQREALFNDILHTWELGPDRQHFMATVVGLRREKRMIGTDEYQVVEIVDGQQRITTLILLLKVASKLINAEEPEEIKIKEEIEELLVKDDKISLLLLQTNHDVSNFFANYVRTGNHPSSDTAVTSADRELLLAMEECEKFVQQCSEDVLSLINLVSLLKNRLNFVFHEIGDEALVYTVFEVLNSRGLAVSWFDRLKSNLMAIVFETKDNTKEIIDEVHNLWSDLYRCIGLTIGMRTEALRFAAVFKEKSAPSSLPSEQKAASILQACANGGVEEVINVTNWVKLVTETLNVVLSDFRLRGVTRIIQARLVAVAVNMRHDLSIDDKKSILEKWEKVTFRLYGLHRKDARYSTGEYTRLAWRIHNEKLTSDKIIDGLNKIGKDYPIDEALDSMQKMDSYNGWQDPLRYFFYRYEEYLANEAHQKFDNDQWNKIWLGNASDSIEHILPQSSGNNNVHRLGNLVLLPLKLNSKLRDLPAAKKAGEYRATGMLIAKEAADSVEAGRWGPTRIQERQDALLEWAKTEWGD